CARRYLREVLRERLIGGGTQPHPTEKAASSWVMATGLEERGSHRSISRAVLTDTREEREVTGGAYALDPEAVMQKPVTEFLAALAAQEDYLTGQALPGIRAMAERNLERLRGALPDQVATMLEEAFAAGGVRGALAARAAVERELTAMSGALAGRQSEDEAVRAEVAAHLAGAREELERKAGLLGKLFGKSRELRQKLGQLQADVMQLDLDLLARTAAMRLVDAARTVLEEQRRRLEALETQLTRLQSLVEAEIAQEQWAPDTGSAYALETEVIRPEHFPAYYERFRPASPEGFLGSLTTGEGGGYLPRLCGREYAELSTLLHGAARAQFQDRVERLNVVEVLGELYDRTDAFHLLDDLARRCQPFWTASPRGAGAFSDVFLIGSPGIQPGGPSTPVQAEPLLQEWVDQHAGGSMGGLHSAPTYVALGTPGSIIFSRQTHGARLHYMRQILDYQEHYRMLQQQRGYPVHFKSCLEALPELRPDDEKATEAWALGVAYGMIALKDFGWVWALDSEQRKDHEVPGAFRTVEFLRTSSVWDIAAEIVPVEGRETQPHSSRFLHATRSGALGQFSQRREFIAAAERKVRQRLDGSGKLAVGNELTRYLEEVLGPRCRRADEMEAATMTKEYTAIRRYLDRLNL
ncbi:MAG TPA: hypothetical protein VK464_08095, partial [Symbiobacteriaceae bacterium]|nr:hypothetical protein [Symbiobacteriaceae bacterium]